MVVSILTRQPDHLDSQAHVDALLMVRPIWMANEVPEDDVHLLLLRSEEVQPFLQ